MLIMFSKSILIPALALLTLLPAAFADYPEPQIAFGKAQLVKWGTPTTPDGNETSNEASLTITGDAAQAMYSALPAGAGAIRSGKHVFCKKLVASAGFQPGYQCTLTFSDLTAGELMPISAE